MSQTTFDIVVHLYESAIQSIKSDDKEKALNQIKELIVYKDPSLLDNFFEDILGFLMDSSATIRQCVIEFIGSACEIDNSFLLKSVERLKYVTDDKSPNVLKKLAFVMITLYRLCLTKAVKNKDSNQNDIQAFEYSLLIVEDVIKKMLEVDNGGLIMMGIKLIESIIILQSTRSSESEIPKSHENDISLDQIPINIECSLLDIKKLKQYSDHLFNVLLEISKKNIRSSLIHTFLQSFTNIAKQRPQFMNKVIGIFELTHVNLPDSLSEQQVSSIRKSLKIHLLNLLKHPSCNDLQTQVTTLLLDLGATQSEINKVIPKTDDSRKRKRKDEISNNNNIKRSKNTTLDDPDYLYNNSVIRKYADQKKITSTQPVNSIEDLTQELIPKLNIVINVTDLVLLSMTVLPDCMPPTFQSAYTPIAAAGTQSQISHLARLLAAQFVSAGYTSLDQNKNIINKETEGFDTDSSHSIFENISNLRNISGSYSMVNSKKPSFKQFKLEDITKLMHTEEEQKMMHESYWRILESDVPNSCLEELKNTNSIVNANINTSSAVMTYNYSLDCYNLPQWYFQRIRILTTVPDIVTGGSELYPILTQNCVDNIRTKFDLLSSLVMREYTRYKAFEINKKNKSEIQRLHNNNKHNRGVTQTKLEDYDKLLVSILKKLITSDVKQTYVGRLLSEAPLLTEGALNTLRSYCSFKPNADYGFQVVRDLIIGRVQNRPELIQLVLDFSHNECIEVRTAALGAAKWLIFVMPQYSDEILGFAKSNLSYLLESKPSTSMYPLRDSNVPLSEWSEYSIRPCLYLFLSLMPIRSALLHLLSSVFISCAQICKHTIIKMIDIPIKEIGMESEEIFQIIDNCDGHQSVTLIARIVHILTDKCDPTPTLVNKLKILYETKFSDVRLLIPILRGLDKNEIIEILPELVRQSDKVLSEVFRRLLDVPTNDISNNESSQGQNRNKILPEELLVALHQLENKKVDLKTIIDASKLCFREKHIFTQERLSIVIGQLLELPVLPTLFMRTIMQSISNYPRMANYVVSVLVRLINKQVWKNNSLWAGFIRCCEKLGQQSYSVLLQLPVERLENVFNSIPTLKDQLKEYVNNCTSSQKHSISNSVLNLINTDQQNNTVDTPVTNVPGIEKRLSSISESMESNNDIRVIDSNINISSIISSSLLTNLNNEIEDISMLKSDKPPAPISNFSKPNVEKELSEEDRKKKEKTIQLLETSGIKISFLPDKPIESIKKESN